MSDKVPSSNTGVSPPSSTVRRIRGTLKRLLASFLAVIGSVGQPQVVNMGPEFSEVTSIQLAEAEVQKGNLVRIHLFPIELGGHDVPQNVTYIPVGMAEMWQALIGSIKIFGSEGLIDKLRVEPEYNGASFVPCRIKIIGTHSASERRFEPVLELWTCT